MRGSMIVPPVGKSKCLSTGTTGTSALAEAGLIKHITGDCCS
jgi:hypothetical protein